MATRKPIKKRPGRLRPRSLLLYMAGDNDLSDAGLRDIRELCNEGSSPEVYVAAEIDTRGEYDGSIRYEITDPKQDPDLKARRVVIERLMEQDSGKPKTLNDFLRWALKRYPAEETVLVIGGHGDGFRARRRAIALDDFGSTLDMPEIEHVLKRSGIGPKAKIAILGFDACLMCMLEIAHHFERYAQLLVGSQQVEPGDGWPYDKVLVHLKRRRSPIGSVAVGIAEVYTKYYRDRQMTNLTQSAVQLDRTGSAMNRMSDLGEVLARKYQNGLRSEIVDCRRETQTFELADYVDALHLAKNLQRLGDPEITAAADAFAKAISDCVLLSKHHGPEVRNANGLSIWFPDALFAFVVHRAKYTGLRGTTRRGSLRPGGWLHFLDTYHGR